MAEIMLGNFLCVRGNILTVSDGYEIDIGRWGAFRPYSIFLEVKNCRPDDAVGGDPNSDHGGDVSSIVQDTTGGTVMYSQVPASVHVPTLFVEPLWTRLEAKITPTSFGRIQTNLLFIVSGSNVPSGGGGKIRIKVEGVLSRAGIREWLRKILERLR